MRRDVDQILKQWKDDPNRKPLLVRGARKVGKSYTIEAFGQAEFAKVLTVNFEQNPRFRECFVTHVPRDIVNILALMARTEIVPGKTLLFLDEIQDCPSAILALRYFFEQMPELHVIGAGSLLEFAMERESFRMPVGRVEYLYMRPLSFLEFLDATGDSQMRQAIEAMDQRTELPAVIHDRLLELVRVYALLGGMPAVVAEYAARGDLIRCQRNQSVLIHTYRDDFGKYAGRVKHRYLQKVFSAVPRLIGRKFKYVQVDDSVQSRELKEALELLEMAGVVSRIRRTSGAGLPLETLADERHFKVVFLDVGLVQNMCGTEPSALTGDLIQVNQGAIAEQFVAQELRAYQGPFQDTPLFFWAREARNSSAEVDYLFPCQSRPLPVEVKAGKTGTLRSLHLYLEQYHLPVGIRISSQPLSLVPPLLSVPFYAIRRIPALLG